MKFKFMVLCESCIVDQRSNNVSLINVIEEMNVTSLPIMLIKATLVALSEKEPSDATDIFSLVVRYYANATLLHEQTVNIDFKGRKLNRLVLEFNGLPIKEVGLMNFEIHHAGQLIKNYLVPVNLPEQIKAVKI